MGELEKFKDVKGTTSLTQHRITVTDNVPVKQRYQARNPAMLELINQKIDELVEKDCIEPSRSAYSSPIVSVPKKNGKMRLCIDFRQINAKSKKDAYPCRRSPVS
jgi:hypothetical protein